MGQTRKGAEPAVGCSKPRYRQGTAEVSSRIQNFDYDWRSG